MVHSAKGKEDDGSCGGGSRSLKKFSKDLKKTVDAWGAEIRKGDHRLSNKFQTCSAGGREEGHTFNGDNEKAEP